MASLEGLTPYQLQIIKKGLHTWAKAYPYVDENPAHQELIDFIDLQVDEQMQGAHGSVEYGRKVMLYEFIQKIMEK